MPTLIKLSSNWADEMDIEGFFITNDSKDQILKRMKEIYMQKAVENISISDLDLEPKDSTAYAQAKRAYKPYTLNLSQEVADMLLEQPIEGSIGTNEELQFENFDHYQAEHTIEEISQEEYQIIEKRFGTQFGHAPRLEDYSNITINIV